VQKHYGAHLGNVFLFAMNRKVEWQKMMLGQFIRPHYREGLIAPYVNCRPRPRPVVAPQRRRRQVPMDLLPKRRHLDRDCSSRHFSL
jgi:hypothetical protein